jgi:hypothetical protein
MQTGEMSAEVRARAISDALECLRVCEETLSCSLHQGGRHVEAEHVKLMIDCAEICGIAAAFMQRGSRHMAEVSRVCAAVCLACAVDCAQFEGDEHMTRCVEACRRCADSCTEMAGALA